MQKLRRLLKRDLLCPIMSATALSQSRGLELNSSSIRSVDQRGHGFEAHAFFGVG